MIKEHVTYTTSDGTIFDKWCDADAYEKSLKQNKDFVDRFVWDILPELDNDIKKLISMRLRDNLHRLNKIHNWEIFIIILIIK